MYFMLLQIAYMVRALMDIILKKQMVCGQLIFMDIVNVQRKL